MEETISQIPSGGVTSPKGFCAGAVAAGIKKKVPGALDLAVLSAGKPVTAAALFTRNKVKAAPVIVSQQRLVSGKACGVVVNSGCAYASSGEPAIRDAATMADQAASCRGLEPDCMLVASTGVIGHCLPMDRIEAGLSKIKLSSTGGNDFARAIMTTDTVLKEVAVKVGYYTIGGCGKGSGMIHPDMATMLVFLTTDVPVEVSFLKQALKKAADVSFNMLTIDGDTSTNDSLFMFSNGEAGGETITAGSPGAETFQQALDYVCIHLAKAMARDGEGATKRIEVTVRGAASLEDARKAARTIALSSLVKTAVHGADPNWGRVLAAAGRSGVELIPEKTCLEYGGIPLVKNGAPLPFDEKQVSDYLRNEDVVIVLDLNLDGHQATAWGCDLSRDYVTINADYTT